MYSDTLIRKAAVDAGFDLQCKGYEDWLCFAVSGAPIQVWVKGLEEELITAISSEAVIRELTNRFKSIDKYPADAAGAIRCTTYEDLLFLLTRARVLDATLPDRLHKRWMQRLASISVTETETTIKQRIGQDLFREGLMDYWEGCCAVTGLDVPELLRASHAKPWKDSSDEERLDVHNGLLLAVHLDALFDRGFLMFDEEGVGKLHDSLSTSIRTILGVDKVELRLSKLTERHEPYLNYHRNFVFKGK